ncbi:Retrovirus-related Pol polyprotein from transposon RE1 [Vitis vinifera]|uniref:Retrovirus-related Pol polyprotein from transposon RE1 n=1 Tax=Vitis vinifera TaxID=29760 RepID=A0A438CH82_VITVI|nr:Retrovirus-related Pol polyprotein from transposon RE1 [Vitis vinifera]
MHSEFEMSMMGELNFFLGLQIKQLKEGTFINQAKYIRDLLKRFNMEEAKTMKTPMSSSIKLDKDEKGKSINPTMYRGMIGSLLYLTTSKKQNLVALSMAEAEYIAAALTVDQAVDRFVEAGDLKRLPRFIFSTVLLHSLKTLHIPASRDQLGLDLGPFEGLGVDFGTFNFIYVRLGLLVGFLSLMFGFVLYSDFISSFSAFLMAPRRRRLPLRLRASALLSHLSLSRRRLTKRRGPVMSTVRGVEIRLSPESIYSIFNIPLVGLRVYESRVWPTVPGFEPREAIQSTTRVLPYGHFLTRVFKGCRVDLSRETDFEAPTSYDTYDEQSLGQMKFEKAPDGSWIRKAE